MVVIMDLGAGLRNSSMTYNTTDRSSREVFLGTDCLRPLKPLNILKTITTYNRNINSKEEEIEDLVGDIKYTNSSKSITSSIICSYDLSDSSPERNCSSDRNTYILGYDDTDSESTERTFELQHNLGCTNMLVTNGPTGNQNLKAEKLYLINKHTHKSTVAAQEIFTQTSKTILELASNEGGPCKKDTENLQTQTSCISFCANNFLKYNHNLDASKPNPGLRSVAENNTKQYNEHLYNNTKNIDELTTESEGFSPSSSDRISNDDVMPVEPTNNIPNEQDENDIEHLYKKVLENIQIQTDFSEYKNLERIATLSPVTEESTNKSIIDITPNEVIVGYEFMDDTATTKTKYAWPEELNKNDNTLNNLKQLQEIRNYASCPNTPHSNFLFTMSKSDKLFSKSGKVFTVNETEKGVTSSDVFASGENSIPDSKRQSIDIYLPPIHNNSNLKKPAPNSQIDKMFRDSQNPGTWHIEPICINEKIQELKLAHKKSPSTNQSSSPKSSSPDNEISERSCEALCVEVLRRLKSNSWTEAVEALEWIPKCFEKFWEVIPEIRIADLIRQVTTSIESPRTQVSKAACATLTVILQKTNYVKKPEFYEALSSLLNKTGSYSRPLRRVANLSLDRVICEVDTTHAVTALCMYGSSHKSGLVRSAAARLLVVSAALAAGGRHLLKSRPSTVTTARQHLLRSLSALLEDKNGDTRKFAERLYSILRPLKNFEAYFLNDVNVDVATRQMKKYDQTINVVPDQDTSFMR